MEYKAHNYGKFAFKHIIEHPSAGLFMGMGLGKTVISCTAINWLMFEEMEVQRVLVVAPLKVAETVWTDEAEKWDHLNHIKFSLVLGKMKDRLAALKAKADVYIINPENVDWLVTHYQSAWPFDMLVIDESSKFKNPDSKRFRSIKMVLPFCKRIVILTGTPIPNGLPDIWSQIYLLDRGKRLGNTITDFRNEYLYTAGGEAFKYTKYDLTNENKKRIYDKIGDVCISMKAADYLELPKRTDIIRKVKLSDELMERYFEFEESEVLNLVEEVNGIMEISVPNAAALMTKLLQFGSGAVYTDKERKNYAKIHEEKIIALEELVEAAAGDPILCFYQFRHSLELMQKRLGGRAYKDRKDLEDWNKGKIPLLYAHPASMAYGLNMQDGGHINVWYGVPYNLEYFDQGNARTDRQGQTKPVFVYKLVCPGTVDMDAVKAIDTKTIGQGALMEAIRARVTKYTTK